MSKAVMTIHGFLTTTDDFGRLNQYLDHYDVEVVLTNWFPLAPSILSKSTL